MAKEVLRKDLEALNQGVKDHWGALSRIAKEAGKSISYCRQVLNGERINIKVIEVAGRVIRQMKQERLNKDSEISEILQKALA